MTAGELKKLRNSLGKTQAEFAAIVGVSTRTIESYEQGARKISRYMAFYLESHLRQYLAKPRPPTASIFTGR